MKTKLVSSFICLSSVMLGSCGSKELIKPIFTNLEDSYYTFNSNIKPYMDAENPNVTNFNYLRDATYQINIKFKTDGIENITSKTFYYSLNKDFKNAEKIELKPRATTASLTNLYKNSIYYIKLVISANGKDHIQTGTFKTSDIGPRVLTIEGIDNVRDVGGYKTSDGTFTKQGLIYRGSELNEVIDEKNQSHGCFLTTESEKYMSQKIGIKSDVDIRMKGLHTNGNITKSPISTANLAQFEIGGGYTSFFETNQKQVIKEVFKFLSNPNNYPVYIHCWGGADRTATLCFIYNALLGVEKVDLIHDYEFTTFSKFGERNSKWTTPYNFKGFLDKFESLDGQTYQEKAKTYLKYLGITETEINNIISIMK